MSIQHLYSLDPLYGLFEKARRLAGIYWVEDIKTNTSGELECIYTAEYGAPFTGFDIDTISGGQVKDSNGAVVMGHFKYNDETNLIEFIPSVPLTQIRFTYTRYTGKWATSNEIKGKDGQTKVVNDEADPSAKIISLEDNITLKGITIRDDNDSALYSLPKSRGAPNSTLGINSDDILTWINPIASNTTSFTTTDDIRVTSFNSPLNGNTIYSLYLNYPLKPGDYSLPVSAGTAGQILVTKGSNLQAEWMSPSAAAVTINGGNNVNVSHDENGYLIALKDDVNIAGNFSINNKQFPTLSGMSDNSALMIENGNMVWSAPVVAGNNLSSNGKALNIVDEPQFQGLSIVGQASGTDPAPLYITFPQSAPTADNSIITHNIDGTTGFVQLSADFGNEVTNVSGDSNITVEATGNARTVKLNNGIGLGNVQINKTADLIQAPDLHITESVRFGAYTMPIIGGGNNTVLLYDSVASQAKWAAPVNMPSGAVWFSGYNGITITPATVPESPSTVTIGLDTIPAAKVRSLQMVDINNTTIYTLPTTVGEDGQVLTASSNAGCLWTDPTRPAAGNGLVYTNDTYSLSNDITLNTDPINVDDEIKIQLINGVNSTVTSLIKSKNAHFQNITLGTVTSNYTLPTSPGSSNQTLGYDSTGQLGWLQRADAGLAAGNNIEISAESVISVADVPVFSGVKIGPDELTTYTLPILRPDNVGVDYVLNYKPDSTTSFEKAYGVTASQTTLNEPIKGITVTKNTTDRVYDIKLSDYVFLDNLNCNSLVVKKKDTDYQYSLPTPINIPTKGTNDPFIFRIPYISNAFPTVSSWVQLSSNFTIISGVLSLVPTINTSTLTTTDLLTNSIKAVGVATEIKALSNFTVENKTLTVKNGYDSVKIYSNRILLDNSQDHITTSFTTIKKDSIELKNMSENYYMETTIKADSITTPSVISDSITVNCILSTGVNTSYKLPNTTIPSTHNDIHAWGLIKTNVDPQVPLEFASIQYKPYKNIYSSSYDTYPRADGSDIINLVVRPITYTLTSFNGVRTISFSLSATRVRYIGYNNVKFDSNPYAMHDFIYLNNGYFSPGSAFSFNETTKDTLNYLGVIPGIKYDAGGSSPSRCDFGLYLRQYANTKQWSIILKRLDNEKITQHELYKFGIDYDNLFDTRKSWGELETNFTFTY
jgi:hypothetical protein